MHSSIVVTGLLTLLAGSAMADFKFNVYTSSDCSGGFTTITGPPAPSKNNFSPEQHSFKLLSLSSNQHVTLYTGSNQSGNKAQYSSSLAGGPCQGFSSLSYGVYNN